MIIKNNTNKLTRSGSYISKALNFIIFSNVKGGIIVNNKVKTFNKASSSLDLVVILLCSYFNKLD